MKSGIHIQVGSGGSAAFGNVVQGDGNSVRAGDVQGGAGARFDRFIADLPALAKPYDRPADELARLTREIERLRREATAEAPDVARGSGIVASIRRNFGWAWPAVKALLEGAWPVVLTAVLG